MKNLRIVRYALLKTCTNQWKIQPLFPLKLRGMGNVLKDWRIEENNKRGKKPTKSSEWRCLMWSKYIKKLEIYIDSIILTL